MKRYLVFYWSLYYPNGGMNDLQKDFDIQSEAEEFLVNCFEEDGGARNYHRGSVFDIKLGENVKELY